MRNIGPFGLENRVFAGICGLGALIVALILFGWGFFGSLIFGIIVGIIVLMWLLMRAGDASGSGMNTTASGTSHGATSAGTAATSTGAAATPTSRTDVSSNDATSAATPASDAIDASAASETATSSEAAATTEAAAPTETAAPAAPAATKVNESAKLPGQDDLASRKGEWKYEGGDAEAEPAAEKKAAPAEKAAPTAKKPAKEKAKPAVAADGGNQDYDGDGVIEGENEGSKPATLTAAREGGADDLKQIKGVGPKMEGMLHGMGFFHFDQVAAWTAAEVAWVDANLKGFRGRVSRDNWVDQAKTLAAGGETEFSKKVEKGGVY